ncbi:MULTISPECIES: exodeoxyribonuclease V subunit beta [Pasteurellaceae]|uniref:exodeoxyribonuclease V subunit beta n=1 Tax=Pasteurellaceae TaxID=712 RepID=UPI00356534F8
MNQSEPLNPVTVPLNRVSLIEASAGTGKTHTMASLYLRLLLQAGENNFARPLSVEQILVVTFTDMATEELRERIRARIHQARQQFIRYRETQDKGIFDDDFLSDLIDHIDDIEAAIHRLTLAEQNMDLAAVYTIHGFCRRILMQYAFNSGIHFNLDLVTDESELLQRMVNTFWREQFYPQPVNITEFIRQQFGSPDNLIKKIRTYMTGDALTAEISRPDLLQIPLATFFAEHLAPQLAGIEQFKRQWLAQEETVRHLLEDNKARIKGYRDDYLRSRLRDIRRWAENPAEIDLPEKLTKYFTQAVIDAGLKNGGTLSHPLFQQVQQLAEQAMPCAALNSAIILYHCLRDVRQKLIDYKLHHNQKGFDDLLRLVRDALCVPQGGELAQLVRYQYPFAMIDEFQDTDAQQYQIFSRVYIQDQPPHTGFIMIGDPKQSIYKFRGADIFTYLAAARQANSRFTLEYNWRSGQNLIDCVNGIFDFSAAPPFLFDNIRFLPVKAGRATAPFQLNGAVEPALRVYVTQHGDHAALARACAVSVWHWLQSAVQNQAVIEDRPLLAKNIAVLVKNRYEAELVKNALQQLGVASVYLSDKSNVFDSPTARDMALILTACLNPLNERAVLNAVATGLFGLTSAEIYHLRQDETQWENTVEQFVAYRQIWHKQGVLVMLHKILLDRRFSERLLASAGGERIVTDFLHLAELLQQASRLNETEAALLRWFEKQIQGTERLQEIIRLESERELVKIVTIHKSKGLAYDLVWLPFVAMPAKESTKRADPQAIHTYYCPSRQQVLWDLEGRHRDAVIKENLAEEMRLLYVALTRAKYQVVMALPADFEGKWNSLLYALSEGKIGQHLTFKTPQYQAQALIERLQQKVGAHNILLQDATTLVAGDPLTQPAESEALSAAEFSGHIEYNWQVTSFSDMAQKHDYLSTRREQDNTMQSAVEILPVFDSARDYDFTPLVPEDTMETLQREDPPHIADDYPPGYSPFTFPHGARVGTELHRYLENAEFSQPPGDEQLAKLCRNLQLDEPWLAPLRQWLSAIVHTPLPIEGQALNLAKIDRRERVKEMPFYLKLTHDFNVGAFNRALKQYHHLPYQPLIFNRIKGMLRGFIDLVFRHDGKYYLMDYKSNWLGAGAQYYGAENLQQAMLTHHYDWQYLLYSVALHRYLGQRKADYDYTRHFGGVIYTFLRGMNGKDATGVYFDKPDRRLIEELETLF